MDSPAPNPATRRVSAADHAMRRYASGDTAAFRDVYAALAPRLRTYLRRLSGSADLTRELSQETFLKLHRARRSFEPTRGVEPWALAIARNCFISHIRLARSRVSRSSVELLESDTSAPSDSEPEDALTARECLRAVERTLETMTPARRDSFSLLYFDGMSVPAAAKRLGVSENALKVRAFHARSAVRAALAVE